MRAFRPVALIVGAAGVITGLTLFWAALSTQQQRFFGFEAGGGNGSHYLFFSGWGSILLPWMGNAVIATAVLWWHSQCVVHGCYWPSRRRTAANEKVCFRHVPQGSRRTWEDVSRDHHLYLGHQPGRG